MDPSADELAGVVDVFGALTRAELREALSELAFKRDEDLSDPAGSIDDAVASYHLVEFDRNQAQETESSSVGDADVGDGDGTLLVPGPTAFPDMPVGAEDLPHIMDVPDRTVDRSALAEAVTERFREETTVALRAGDPASANRLLDVSYELEAWGSADVSDARDRLVDATED